MPTCAPTVCVPCPSEHPETAVRSRGPAWTGCILTLCLLVLPEGPVDIVGEELSGEYYERAAPVVEKLVAQGGYRLAKWLDLIVDEYLSREGQTVISEEL